MGKNEADLDMAFANKIKESPEFLSWLVSHTKFSACGSEIRLLDEEQATARKAKYWWKHWWCRVPELSRDSETDIFVIIEVTNTKQRFALHIENKKAIGTFTKSQPESYQVRAKHMMERHRTKFGYTDFDTVLIAPRSFRDNHRERCDLFGCYISYEAISDFVPDFAG